MKGLEEILQKHSLDFSSVVKVTAEKPQKRPEVHADKKKGGTESVEDAVQELNEIAGRVNDMQMARSGYSNEVGEEGGDMKNIVI